MSNKNYVLDTGPSSCKKRLLEPKASISNHTANGPLRKAEIEQIEDRLRALEDEYETLKGAFLASMEERAKLIAEIKYHFNSLMQNESNRRALFVRWLQTTSLVKEKRVGLPQILCQESNPSIVKRGLKAKALG